MYGERKKGIVLTYVGKEESVDAGVDNGEVFCQILLMTERDRPCLQE